MESWRRRGTRTGRRVLGRKHRENCGRSSRSVGALRDIVEVLLSREGVLLCSKEVEREIEAQMG